jgi:hydrogenase expression/formation protein HypC
MACSSTYCIASLPTVRENGENNMCLAIPAKVIALNENDEAVVDMGGIRKSVSVMLVDGVTIGDYVIIHVGHAIEIIDDKIARQALNDIRQMDNV